MRVVLSVPSFSLDHAIAGPSTCSGHANFSDVYWCLTGLSEHPFRDASRFENSMSVDIQVSIESERSLQRGFQEAGVHGSRGRTGVPSESEHASRQWMLRVLQCRASVVDLRSLISKDGDRRIFLKMLKDGKLRDRNKVLAVLARRRGIPYHIIARFLFVTRNTIASYCNSYDIYGCERLSYGL